MGPPKIIFGGASIGMSFKTVEEVQSILDTLKQNNVTHLDTAARYPPTSPGRSETLLGELKAAFQGFTIDTKVLAVPGDGSGELMKAAIEKSIATSLERLGVSQVDVLYCHRPDPQTPLQEQAAAFDALYKAGKFKRFGVSNFRPETLEQLLEICEANGYVKPSVYQGEYRAVMRGMEKVLLPLLRAHGMTYVAYRTLNLGILSGASTHGPTADTRLSSDGPLGVLAQGQYYSTPLRAAPTGLEASTPLHAALTRLETSTRALGISTVEALLRWVCYHSALCEQDGVILGASRVSQLAENLQSVTRGPLPEECAEILEEVWQELEPVRSELLAL